MAPGDNQERLACRAMVALPSCIDEMRPLGRGENTLDGRKLITRLLEVTSDPIDFDQDSLSIERVASDPVVEGPVIPTEVRQMAEDTVNQPTNKLDARVVQVTKDYLIGIMKNIDDDHKKAFGQKSLRKATCIMLTFIFNPKDVRDVFDTAVTQAESSHSS